MWMVSSLRMHFSFFILLELVNLPMQKYISFTKKKERARGEGSIEK